MPSELTYTSKLAEVISRQEFLHMTQNKVIEAVLSDNSGSVPLGLVKALSDPEIDLYGTGRFLPGENRPLLIGYATKVTNRGLDDWFETYQRASNFPWNPRIIEGDENMEPGEVCSFYAVAPFGKCVRCLVIQRPTRELLGHKVNKQGSFKEFSERYK